ncbi:hypothetical protein [Halomonas huangheensis]|uniref:DUF2232 domain-containing protein n=1 Tax=Halomonas huangheensis TaxID=1178482 RepID=W1N3H5_9GAMM|nr:hypothetical protein [Halomonas huangheensis]ALM51592.1 hypothetical protein AR456_04305 [Halomonas huangheensis]ERL50073.1 hypothetical protein BJB45_02820 [Halomonas huangheensis]
MLPIARWSMKGTPQAAAVVLLTSVAPFLMVFWFGSAIVALVALRRGLSNCLPVAAASLVPAVWWWTQGEPVPLVTTLLAMLMATVLRSRIRWSEALVAGALGGIVLAQLGVYASGLDISLVLEQMHQAWPDYASMIDQMAAEYGVSSQQMLTELIVVVRACAAPTLAVLALILARAWQSGLYNPGGFREEFHALRLNSRELLLLVAVLAVGYMTAHGEVAYLAALPILMAGIGLIHGVVGRKGMNGVWLVAFYVMLIILQPMILIVLVVAMLDTLLDIRRRLGHDN